MNQFEKTLRDVANDSHQALHYKGFVFPKYEGLLTEDEIKSRQKFYAFWGELYLAAPAIRYQVDQLLLRERIPKAA